jgi:hypothetical protein
MVDSDSIRADLARSRFDSSAYLETQLEDVDIENLENFEESLTLIFSGLASELALASDDVEAEISSLQNTAREANSSMVGDMAKHLERLNGVQEAVEAIKSEFDSASEGAVKIGDRLTTSVEEKRRLLYGIELVEYVNWLKHITPSDYEVKLSSTDLDTIKLDALPPGLQQKDWGYVSLMLNDMRRLLYEISEDDAMNALKNVHRLSEHVETELLNIFLDDLGRLMDDPEDTELVERCKRLAKWLHLYNNGQTLLKRYVFTVIEKRMPDSMFEYDPNGNSNSNSNSQSPAGAGAGDLDYLSQLFATIQTVCVEQFRLLRLVFPEPVVRRLCYLFPSRITYIVALLHAWHRSNSPPSLSLSLSITIPIRFLRSLECSSSAYTTIPLSVCRAVWTLCCSLGRRCRRCRCRTTLRT